MEDILARMNESSLLLPDEPTVLSSEIFVCTDVKKTTIEQKDVPEEYTNNDFMSKIELMDNAERLFYESASRKCLPTKEK